MTQLSIRSMAGDWRTLGSDVLRGYRGALRGELVWPGERAYEQARSIYNAMIDRHPGAIVRCADVADVMTSVRFAREHGLLVSVRGGGHNGPGLCLSDGGLVIDLSNMRGVRVDPEARTATVQGGCRWGDVDHATHPFGLATVSGIISTTGVGGLTLGGGHGHLTRKYGLTIDNLLEADVVLADGQFVQASPQDHPDLFWALRGGGGNFGIVTSFTFRLHPVDHVYAGPMLWDMEHGREVLTRYRDLLPAAPEDVNGFFAFMTVPPAPPFPESLHGRRVCGIVWCCDAPQSEAEAVVDAFRSARTPVFEHLGEMPYPAVQSMFDDLYPPGLHWYWKGDFFRQIDDDAVEKHVQHASTLPTLHSTMHLYPIDGAVHRTGPHETAFSYRNEKWSQVIVGVDPDPANVESMTRWARAYWDALHPHSSGAGYVNFMMSEGQTRIEATYGDNYARLVEVKRRYDPENFFRMNQNIATSLAERGPPKVA
jgi:FAD/FMN-containing dehydrogenase